MQQWLEADIERLQDLRIGVQTGPLDYAALEDL